VLSFAAFRTLRTGRDGLTFTNAAAQAEIDPNVALNLWRGAGFSDPRPFERRFGPQDVEMFRLFGLLSEFVPHEHVLQLMRTMGEAVRRVAEAEVAMLRSNIEAPLAEKREYVEVARTYRAVAEAMLPRISEAMDAMHRHHLQAIGRRYSEVNAPTSALNVVQLAVGFADLAGYTGLWQELEPQYLAEMLDRFEATTGDVIAATGANVVKRIGDAVMFVSNAPRGCVLARARPPRSLRGRAPAEAPRGGGVGGRDGPPGRFLRSDRQPRSASRLLGRSRDRAHRRRTTTGASNACAAATRSSRPGKYKTLAGFLDPVEAFHSLRP